MGNTVTRAELHFRHAGHKNHYAVRLGADTGAGSGPVEWVLYAEDGGFHSEVAGAPTGGGVAGQVSRAGNFAGLEIGT